MRYKNAFYEFKPNYKKYDFIVPSKNFDKTLRKMRYSLKNEKKIVSRISNEIGNQLLYMHRLTLLQKN